MTVVFDVDEAEVLGASEDDNGLDVDGRSVEDNATDTRTFASAKTTIFGF